MKNNLDWQRDPSISPADYERLLRSLGMNVSSAARFLRVGIRTNRRYVSGEVTVPAAIVMLLRLMAATGRSARLTRQRSRRMVTAATEDRGTGILSG